MNVPERFWRFPTPQAMAALVSRFGFDAPGQDPEVEWSDPARIAEFVAAYEQDPLTDDERFLLMAVIVNSFEFAERSTGSTLSTCGNEPLDAQLLWKRTLELLDRDIGVHIFTVLYFSGYGDAAIDPADDPHVAPDVRALALKHRDAFGLA